MAIGVTDDITNARYVFNLTFQDRNNEETRKRFSVNNYDTENDEEGVNEMLSVLALMSYSGIRGNAFVDTEFVSSGDELTPDGTEHLLNSAAILLVLGFDRVSPLNPLTTLKTTFTIPSPKAAYVDMVNKLPVYDPEYLGDIDGASNATETMTAFIHWLEGAMAYKLADGIWRFGGWTFRLGRSGLVQQGRLLDGIPNT